MNINELFNSELTELSDELRLIDNRIKDAAHNGQAGTASKLAHRKKELPSLIQAAKLRDINLQLNDARSKMLVYEMETDVAHKEFMKLATDFPDRARELDLAKEQLTIDVNTAQRDRDNLQFAYQLAQQEYEQLKQTRTSIILSQSDQ